MRTVDVGINPLVFGLTDMIELIQRIAHTAAPAGHFNGESTSGLIHKRVKQGFGPLPVSAELFLDNLTNCPHIKIPPRFHAQILPPNHGTRR